MYKMEGFDKDWIDGKRRFAPYTNLDPGEYTFRVIAANSDGVWNKEGASVKITIHPPWWQTTWAYVGYGVLFFLSIFAVDRIQRRRLFHKAKERMKIQEAEHRAEAAELQAKVVQAENDRKSKELEEARQLQLSMLPKNLPSLPNLDIAVYMKTATEVGGDYYDFNIGLDGTLTCVLGDATGHGMKAGTMVTAVKGLFNSYGANPDILYSFQEISRCIKQMQLEKLSMCMTMLKINNNKLLMSAAGMPPILIYNQSKKSVSEHVIKGMPLGTFDKYPYDIQETKLSTGDTVLLMSDGFPELLNSEGELYGYQRVRNSFENIAEKTPEEIIYHLKVEGSNWVKDKDPDDDVTFVVIQVK
jgi:serine phosphatase RsbU (regulator of sigma subunit)